VSALAGLDEKRAKVQERLERVAEAEREAREAPRRGEREREKLLDYHRQCGADGKTPDPNVEAALGADLAAATGGLVVKPVEVLHGGGQFHLAEKLVDPAAEARLEGAKAALRDARGELQGFIERSLGAIAVERIRRAQALAGACAEAMRATRKAAAEYEAERTWWSGLLVEGGQDVLLPSVPENPLAFVAGAPQGEVPLPMPEPFVP
jgi:hypothetical protein